MMNAIKNNSSSTIENNIPSKQNDNFGRANFFNGLVYKDIMAVENKELNVYKKSEVPITKNNIAKNTLLSDKTPTLWPSECSRDTTDWLPPGMVLNKNTSFIVSDVSDVLTYQKPSCSKELFKIPFIESDKKTLSSDLECNNVVIVDELTQIGKSGLKKPKIINKKNEGKTQPCPCGKLNEFEDEKNELHLYEKEQCKSMFLFDQQISKCKGIFLCSSFDLQKVLSSPLGQNMNLYYSRKFSSYNCTIYGSGTQNAYSYLWGEINGKRGCNEIVTCTYNYLTDLDTQKIYENVALYCDSCTGQNKNRAMLAMISKSLKSQLTYIKEIKIVFLLPGHTYMPVDSVHASIERFVKDKTVWASKVKQIAYSDFYDWKYEADNSNILPKVLKDIDGNIIQISKVRYFVFSCLNLDSEDDNLNSINIHAYFSYNPNCEPKILKLKDDRNKKVSRSTTEVIAKKLYRETIAISKEKYNDLIKLCTSGIIPNEFHEEYLQMRNSTKKFKTVYKKLTRKMKL
ncbi:hypothetical protein QTP88_004788 [Uroleucon formosanum]